MPVLVSLRPAGGAGLLGEGAQGYVTFVDGDVFSWNIAAQVPVGTYADARKNAYARFYCYNKWNSVVYNPNGDTCTCIYDCNLTTLHSTVTGDQTQIYYNLNSNYVKLRRGTTSVHDMLNNVYSKFEQSAGKRVDSSSVYLGSDVSISFGGHGDIAGNR
ncbi:hypothetical protein GQ53DRAFT_825799 [Thozetella sp. PMI_491]|nr:hypothetical protein GQ53DRAFT_825799 [Thozetella sp. PMI_491]